MVATAAAIIERQGMQETEVYFQTRNKPSMTSYGTLELPGGRIQKGEDVFSALKGYAFTPFCCNSYNGSPAIGFIFLCEADGEPNALSSEAENPQWIPLSEIRKLIEEEPHRFFYYYLGALQYYLEQKE
jgi:8-oxo-dGTP pyrophosphatase MutT (NUDIX family)